MSFANDVENGQTMFPSQGVSLVGRNEHENTLYLQSLTFSCAFSDSDDRCFGDKAREGRENQRYEPHEQQDQNNILKRIRLLSGTVPILKSGHVLMINSSKKDHWILPKGGWELDENLENAALRESFEEAGVCGVLGVQLDSVMFESKSNQNKLHMFPLYVTKVLECWPESSARRRKCVAIDDAIEYVRQFRPEYLPFLEQIKREGLLTFKQ